MTTTITDKTPSPAQARPLTPGQQYAADFLTAELTDDSWLAEEIDGGRIVVCPRCHFVRLPKNPFPVSGMTQQANPGMTDADCDVCALLPQSVKFHGIPESIGYALAHARKSWQRRARKGRKACICTG